MLLHPTQSEACKLAVHDIHKRFGDNEVLKGISLTANKGDVISIIGASGSGKSTFLRCINFLEKPNSGRIIVDGEEVTAKADKMGTLDVADHQQLQRIRTRLAMVFQHFNLWAPHDCAREHYRRTDSCAWTVASRGGRARAHVPRKSRSRCAR